MKFYSRKLRVVIYLYRYESYYYIPYSKTASKIAENVLRKSIMKFQRIAIPDA